MGRARRADLAAVLLFFALAVFGAWAHPVEEAGTAERDGFVAQAEQLARGEVPRDAYRPLLYALLTGGLGWLVGDFFLAGRLLANLAAAVLARLAYSFGERLSSSESAGTSAESSAGAWAMALTAVNPNLWILGQHTTTDMPFAALAASVLLAALRYRERPGFGRACAVGGLYGLAAFTRGNAVFLLPVLIGLFWTAPRAHRLRSAAGAVAAAGLAWVPHGLLRRAAFGSPFHDENWKNLAWKLYGEGDWSYLDRVPFKGLLDTVRHDPVAVLQGALSELLRFTTGGAAQLFGTPLHAVAVLFALGLAFRSRNKQVPADSGRWLAFAALSFLLALATLFFTWGRFLLFLLPMGYAFLGASVRGRWWRWGAAGLVALLALKTFAFRLPAFVANHPVAEIAALRALPESAGTYSDSTYPDTYAGTAPFLGRYLDRPYVAIPDAFGAEVTTPALYFQRLERLLCEAGVAYVVVSEVELRSRPRELLGAEPPVPWLEAVAPPTTPGVQVWRFLGRHSGLPSTAPASTWPCSPPSSPPGG